MSPLLESCLPIDGYRLKTLPLRSISLMLLAQTGCQNDSRVVTTLTMIQVMLPTMGVHMPSDIQHSAIPLIKDGRSIALQSYTGSGKVRTPSCEMVFM